jgi:hypothetical protein
MEKERIVTEDNNNKDITWATLCHLTALTLFVGIPFGNILLPLVIWLVKKQEFPFVDEQGKESLNFQISMTIYGIIAGLLCYVFIGFILLPIILVANIVLIIIATVKTSRGEGYSYPLTIRVIK